MSSMKKTMCVLAAILVACCAATAQAGVIGQWTFDSQTLAETSGYAAPGVFDGTSQGTGAYSYSTDTKYGSGYSLNITDGSTAIRVLHSASGDTGYNSAFDGLTAMTLSAWVKITNTGWNSFVIKNGEENGYGLRGNGYTAGTTAFTMRGTSGPNDLRGAIPMASAWHFIVGTWDGTTRSLYVDGVLDVSVASTGLSSSAAYPLAFGGRSISGQWQYGGPMMLDDIRVFNTALTQVQIQSLMAAPTVPEPSTLVLLAAGLIGLLAYAWRKRK